jgi:hypothetical protein
MKTTKTETARMVEQFACLDSMLEPIERALIRCSLRELLADVAGQGPATIRGGRA